MLYLYAEDLLNKPFEFEFEFLQSYIASPEQGFLKKKNGRPYHRCR